MWYYGYHIDYGFHIYAPEEIQKGRGAKFGDYSSNDPATTNLALRVGYIEVVSHTFADNFRRAVTSRSRAAADTVPFRSFRNTSSKKML